MRIMLNLPQLPTLSMTALLRGGRSMPLLALWVALSAFSPAAAAADAKVLHQ